MVRRATDCTIQKVFLDMKISFEFYNLKYNFKMYYGLYNLEGISKSNNILHIV